MLGTCRFTLQQKAPRHVWLLAILAWSGAGLVQGQLVTVGTPMIGVNESFYEHINVGWGFYQSNPRHPWFLNFGNPRGGIPPFGGYDPAADLRVGYGRYGHGSGFHFNLAASQGSNRTLTMSAPSITMMNGVPGWIFSGSMRPFVTGLIPVVGDYPVMFPYAPYPYPFPYSGPFPGMMGPSMAAPVSPLAERLERLRHEPPPVRPPAADGLVLADKGDVDKRDAEPVVAAGAPSSAERGDISVAEIRRLQALEDQAKLRELAKLIQEAEAAERAGQLGVARVRYQQAAKRASGDQRRSLLESVAKLNRQRP